MRVYFPHFMDVEYSQFFGRQRATKLVDHYLKLLALLGARISIAAAILDGDSVQRLITDKKFREFITECDRGFLRLEAGMERNHAGSDREWVARQQWHRVQAPGWVASGRIETPAIVAAAEIALQTGFGDHDEAMRFEAQVKKIVKKFELSKEAHSILVNNFHLLSWYGISDQFVARLNPTPSTTYYQKLLAALETPNMSGEDYAALNVKPRSRRYTLPEWGKSGAASGCRERRRHVPALLGMEALHRTPICDGSRLPGQPSHLARRRRLAFNAESPTPGLPLPASIRTARLVAQSGPEHPGLKVSEHSTYEPRSGHGRTRSGPGST